jgi:hypothetical protein
MKMSTVWESSWVLSKLEQGLKTPFLLLDRAYAARNPRRAKFLSMVVASRTGISFVLYGKDGFDKSRCSKSPVHVDGDALDRRGNR